MPRITLLILLLTVLAGLAARDIFPVPGIAFQPNHYVCYRANEAITLDGKLTEASWKQAEWTENFDDIEGSIKPIPELWTRAKLLWDDKGLYIAAELNEPNVWATLRQHDSVIFRDNDFEVFIDPDGDTHDYYELETNALGAIWDLYLAMPYRDRAQVAVNSWDIKGLQIGVAVNGTLNDASDTDIGWTVEMLLPWESLGECAHMPIPPHEGDQWRLNFSRVEWQTEVQDGKIVKKTDPQNGNPVPESNWVWSPQGLIAMHYPECWGFVQFCTNGVGTGDREFVWHPVEDAKMYLRSLYYLQKQRNMDHKDYARNLTDLNAQPFLHHGKTITPKIETTSLSYIITLPKAADFPEVHIREDGLVW